MKKVYLIPFGIFLIVFIAGFVLYFNSPVFAAPYNDCLTKESEKLQDAGDVVTAEKLQRSCACLEGSKGVPAVVNNLSTGKDVQEEFCSIKFSAPSGALTSIQNILSGGISLILILAGLIAFIYLLLGGIKWITSGGDSAAVEAARGQIVQALIGLIVVFAAWGIIVLFERATGICLGFTCPLSFPTFFE